LGRFRPNSLARSTIIAKAGVFDRGLIGRRCAGFGPVATRRLHKFAAIRSKGERKSTSPVLIEGSDMPLIAAAVATAGTRGTSGIGGIAGDRGLLGRATLACRNGT
jgi:hypothetical protein